MQTETPPRAAFEVKLEKKEYVAAALIGARRSGVLRSAPVVVVISLALLAVGLLTMNWFQGHLHHSGTGGDVSGLPAAADSLFRRGAGGRAQKGGGRFCRL